MTSKKKATKKPNSEFGQSEVEDFFKAMLIKGFGKPEATKGIGEDPAWTHNLKGLVESFGQLNLSSHQGAGMFSTLAFLDAFGSVSRTKVMAEQVIQNAITHAKNVDGRCLIHVPTTDVARDRIWNFTDEIMAQVVGSTGMNRDVVVGILAKVLADMVAANKK